MKLYLQGNFPCKPSFLKNKKKIGSIALPISTYQMCLLFLNSSKSCNLV